MECCERAASFHGAQNLTFFLKSDDLAPDLDLAGGVGGRAVDHDSVAQRSLAATLAIVERRALPVRSEPWRRRCDIDAKSSSKLQSMRFLERAQAATAAMIVVPPVYSSGREPDYNPKEPIGPAYVVASMREHGIRTGLFDADLEAQSISATISTILEVNPRLVGFSVLQRALPSLEEIVRGLRSAAFTGHITCGGIGATLSHEKVLERLDGLVDTVVLGDGEEVASTLTEHVLRGEDWSSIPGIAFRKSGSSRFTPPAASIDLDKIPPPARDYLPLCLGKTGYSTILGSRDCYARCVFCSNAAYARFQHRPGWRPRDPAKTVDELADLAATHGVGVIKFA